MIMDTTLKMVLIGIRESIRNKKWAKAHFFIDRFPLFVKGKSIYFYSGKDIFFLFFFIFSS
jgi:hypothetical protein